MRSSTGVSGQCHWVNLPANWKNLSSLPFKNRKLPSIVMRLLFKQWDMSEICLLQQGKLQRAAGT